MTVVIVKPGYAPYEAEINGLDEMQEVVGGMIQAIYPFEDISICPPVILKASSAASV